MFNQQHKGGVDVHAACRLAPHATSPRAARDFVAAVLGEQPLPIHEVVGVLVTEVVTNAIVHAKTALTVTLDASSEAIRIEVHDDSPALPVVRRAEPDRVGGWGMAIVDGLADAWGVAPGPGPGDGKTVWFEVALNRPVALRGVQTA